MDATVDELVTIIGRQAIAIELLKAELERAKNSIDDISSAYMEEVGAKGLKEAGIGNRE